MRLASLRSAQRRYDKLTMMFAEARCNRGGDLCVINTKDIKATLNDYQKANSKDENSSTKKPKKFWR